MIQPATAAISEHKSTAPAAASLDSLALGFCSGEARSTAASMAVLNASAPSTSAKNTRQTSHSSRLMPKRKPHALTRMTNAKWIFMFRSLLTHAKIPAKACAKLSTSPCLRRIIGVLSAFCGIFQNLAFPLFCYSTTLRKGIQPFCSPPVSCKKTARCFYLRAGRFCSFSYTLMRLNPKALQSARHWWPRPFAPGRHSTKAKYRFPR